MRQRVEDLGRISVMVEELLSQDVWDLYQGRNKDFIDIFRASNEEAQDDLLHNLIYGIAGLKDKLYAISSIAEGTDRLNESVN